MNPIHLLNKMRLPLGIGILLMLFFVDAAYCQDADSNAVAEKPKVKL